MSDTTNGVGLPPTGEMWEMRNGPEWAPAGLHSTEEMLTGDAIHAGQSGDDVPSSYFHVRWLGEAD